MRQTFAIGPRLAFCMLLVASPLTRACTTNGIAAYYPSHFDNYVPECYMTNIELELWAVQSILRITDPIYIHVDEFISNAPENNIPTMISELEDVRTVILFSHGSANHGGSVCTEFYSDVAGLNAGCAAVVGKGWTQDTHFGRIIHNGEYYLKVYGAGISAKLVPLLPDPDFIVLGMSCESESTRDDWGVPSPDIPDGPSMFSYETCNWNNVMCNDQFAILRVMSCDEYFSGWGLELTTGDTEQLLTEAILSGNRSNRINCNRWCFNTVGVWEYTSAYDGMVRLACRGEDPNTSYVVLGDGEVLASFDGEGTSGHGRLRCYSVPVSEQNTTFQCVEIDDFGNQTSSEPFTWDAGPGHWDYVEAVHDLTLNEIGQLGSPFPPPEEWGIDDPRWDWYSEYETWLSEQDLTWVDHGDYQELIIGEAGDYCPHCADILVYAHNSFGGEILPILLWHLCRAAPNARGRLCGGPGDPEAVKDILYEAWMANQAYGGYPVDPGPLLMIVGTYLDIEMLTYPDDEGETCLNDGTCKSYMDIADFDDDGFPECPVQVLPASNTEQVLSAILYAEEWNESPFPTGERIAIFADDETENSGGQASELFIDGLRQVWSAYYDSGYLPSLIKESSFSNWEQKAIAGKNQISQGAREIWVGGERTGPGKLTNFLSTEHWNNLEEQLDSDQNIFIFGPNCETGGFWKGEQTRPHVLPKLMFNHPDRTTAAGMIGQLNSAWDKENRVFATVLMNELINSPAGTPYSLVAYHAARTIQEQFPNYGRGVVMYGAYAVTTHALSAGVDEPHPEEAIDHLWCTLGNAVTNLHFKLSKPEVVNLEVHDVTGRLVSRVKHGRLGPGRYIFSWFQKDQSLKPVGSGTYFARLTLEDSNRVETAKIVILR